MIADDLVASWGRCPYNSSVTLVAVGLSRVVGRACCLGHGATPAERGRETHLYLV